jgi:hypothetical protein
MPRDRYDDDDDDREYDRPRSRRRDDDDEYDEPRYSRRRQQEGTGMAVASLVLGILSILLFLVWFLGPPMGILAIIFGSINKSKQGKGMALAGLIMGAIGLALTLIFYLIVIAMLDRRGFW